MKIYLIKIALRGISPMVWRRLKVPGNTSLAQLHHIIQIANQWDNDYLHQFHIYGKDYGIAYEGGLAFSDNAYKVYLDDFGFDEGDKFIYEYNFFEHWVVDIRIEKIKDVSSITTGIQCLKGKGLPGVNQYDEVEPMLNLLKAIAKADKTTTMGDLRPYVKALNAVRFNRHHINHRLQTEAFH